MRRTRVTATGLVLSVGVVGGALLLGLGTAGVTQALLASSTTVPGATITAGSQELTVNGHTTAALGHYSVLPGAPHAIAFTVANTGTTTVDVGSSIRVTSVDTINEYLLARVTPVASLDACVPDLAGPQQPLDGHINTAVVSVGADESVVLCLEVALQLDTPIEQAGRVADFTATITSTSTPRQAAL